MYDVGGEANLALPMEMSLQKIGRYGIAPLADLRSLKAEPGDLLKLQIAAVYAPTDQPARLPADPQTRSSRVAAFRAKSLDRPRLGSRP